MVKNATSMSRSSIVGILFTIITFSALTGIGHGVFARSDTSENSGSNVQTHTDQQSNCHVDQYGLRHHTTALTLDLSFDKADGRMIMEGTLIDTCEVRIIGGHTFPYTPIYKAPITFIGTRQFPRNPPPTETSPSGFYHAAFNTPQPPFSGTIIARYAGDSANKILRDASMAQKTLTIH